MSKKKVGKVRKSRLCAVVFAQVPNNLNGVKKIKARCIIAASVVAIPPGNQILFNINSFTGTVNEMKNKVLIEASNKSTIIEIVNFEVIEAE